MEDALKNLALKEEVQGYTCTKTKVQVRIVKNSYRIVILQETRIY